MPSSWRQIGPLIGVAVLLFFAMVVPQIPRVEASGGLALDGHGFGTEIGINKCVLNQNLTTAHQPDVIIALVAMNDTTTTVTSPVDTASLVWTPRASQKGPADVQIFTYYAVASQPLPADNITFGLSSSHVASLCEIFGISGADANAPFDPNLSMPSVNGANDITNSAAYNTYNPNDFLIILQGFCGLGAAGSGSPLGFTPIVGAENTHVSASNCPEFLQTNTFYEIVSTTQSSNVVSWQFDTEPSSFAIIGDAIQSTPGPLTASVVAGSNAVYVGQPASFSCSGAGGVYPYTYSWAFGDGSTGSGPSTSHTYDTPGIMNVVCTITDSNQITANSGTQLTVNRRATSTTAVCISQAVVNIGSTCTVTVTDTSPGTFSTPSGTVMLSQTGVTGAFTTCTLAGTMGFARCESIFTASTTGTVTIYASYPGDSTHISSSDTTITTVNSGLSITSFTASPNNIDAGEKIILAVSTSGGNGDLSYSYSHLPAGCGSTNATTLSCYPTSSGNYDVTVTVTDRAGETTTATESVTVGPQKVLGLPQVVGLAVIFGAIGVGATVCFSVALVPRRKRSRQAPSGL
jgi:PKD domain